MTTAADSGINRRVFLGLVPALVLAGTRLQAATTGDVVNVALNPDVYSGLPLFLAADAGYFAKRNLDVRIVKISGSSLSQLPELARGSLDIAPMVLGPAFFNQFASGFDVRLVAGMSGVHAGWNDDAWVMVRQDLWDAKVVRGLADLRGKVIDGYVPGAPPNMLIKETLVKAGLTTADVTFSERLKSAADAYAAYENKAVEVSPAFEPMVTALETHGLAHRWLSARDIMPDYQESFLAASDPFAHDRRDVAVRFLAAYLEAVRDIARVNGKWNTVLIDTVARWSEQPPSTVALIPGPAYPGDGSINFASAERQQQFWVRDGLVKNPVDIRTIVDTTILDQARRAG